MRRGQAVIGGQGEIILVEVLVGQGETIWVEVLGMAG